MLYIRVNKQSCHIPDLEATIAIMPLRCRKEQRRVMRRSDVCPTKVVKLCCPPLFALLVCHVLYPYRAVVRMNSALQLGARRLGNCTRLLALVLEQVAEGR